MPLLYLNTRECRWYLMGEGEMKKIAAISLISIFIMSGCAVHNDETSIGKYSKKWCNSFLCYSGQKNANSWAEDRRCRITWCRSSDIQMWRVRIFFGKRQICAFWLCVAGTCGSTMPISERHRAMKEDSIDVVNGRRLPEIGLMHKKISPCKGDYTG